MERLKIEIGDILGLEQSRRAIVHFVGKTHFSNDKILYGIELMDKALGKHSGTVDGKKYFECETNRGIFVTASKIRKKLELNDPIQW